MCRFFLIFLGIYVAWEINQVDGQKGWSSTSDKETCRSIQFIKVSHNRRVSKTPLTRQSAAQCCKSRGMTLFSVENIDESPSFSKKIEDKLDINSFHWVSASDLLEEGNFTWEFGTPVLSMDGSGATGRGYQWDDYRWDVGMPKVKGRCVAMKHKGDKSFVLMNASCRKYPLPFICEMQPQKGGRDLMTNELMACAGTKSESVPGYPSLQILETIGSWRMAMHCCQSKGWTLVDNIGSKGKRFHAKISSHPWAVGLGHDNLFYWTSGNDLISFRNWTWGCGEPAESFENIEWAGQPKITVQPSTSTTAMPDIIEEGGSSMTPFLPSFTSTISSLIEDVAPNPMISTPQQPDNKFGDENCLAFTDKNVEKGFEGEDESCDRSGSIICDTNPRCTVDQQQKSLVPSMPRTYDVMDDLVEDMEKCSSISFTIKKLEGDAALREEVKNYDKVIFAGNQKLSWNAAMQCCAQRGMNGMVISDSITQSILNTIMYHDAKESSKGWDPKSYWLAASNQNLRPRSQMAWDNGVPLQKYLLNPLKVHDDIHPLCAEFGYIPPKGFFIHTANCLTKNYVLCSKIDTSNVGNHDLNGETPSARDEVELYKKVLAPPTEADRNFSFVVHNRDKCPKGQDQRYTAACETSQLNIENIIKTLIAPRNSTTKEEFTMNMHSRRMLQTAIQDGVYGYVVPIHDPQLGLRLLGITSDIAARLCPIIPPDFIQNAFKIFNDLHFFISRGRTEILKTNDYKWILKLLQRCEKNVKPVRARTDSCGEKMISVGNCTKFICTVPLREFRLSRTDPLIDIMWKTFEVVHSYCFPSFEESYRMFHYYARAILDLWITEIKFRWKHQKEDNEYWVRVLGQDYAMNLLNLERCVQATVDKTFFRIRLPRKTIQDRARLISETQIRTNLV